jgi:hypothetical protein
VRVFSLKFQLHFAERHGCRGAMVRPIGHADGCARGLRLSRGCAANPVSAHQPARRLAAADAEYAGQLLDAARRKLHDSGQSLHWFRGGGSFRPLFAQRLGRLSVLVNHAAIQCCRSVCPAAAFAVRRHQSARAAGRLVSDVRSPPTVARRSATAVSVSQRDCPADRFVAVDPVHSGRATAAHLCRRRR